MEKATELRITTKRDRARQSAVPELLIRPAHLIAAGISDLAGEVTLRIERGRLIATRTNGDIPSGCLRRKLLGKHGLKISGKPLSDLGFECGGSAMVRSDPELQRLVIWRAR